MDAEKSSNSSFEDLSNINETDLKTMSKNLLENEVRVTDSISIPRLCLDSDSDSGSADPSSKRAAPENNSAQISAKENVKESPSSIGFEDGQNDAREPTSGSSSNSEQISAKEDGQNDTPKLSSAKVDKNESYPSVGDDEPCDILGNGQLLKYVLQKSKSSKRPARGDIVTITFEGFLSDGRKVEDKETVDVHVGDYEVVQGLDMALPLMNVGEIAEVVVESRFAYGAIGLKNEENPELSIPPNATIKYKVHLLDSKYEDYGDLKSFAVRRKYGTRKKERANFWYNRCEYNTAIQLYRRALEYLDDRDGDPDAAFDREDIELSNNDLQTLLDDRLVVYNNLAMAQIKILAFEAALKSVENVLRCQPNNSKALYRKGRILEGKGDTKGAIILLQKAATLEPDSKIIQQDLAKLIIKSRREEHNEKEMYQKMLGQAKKLEQKNKQQQKHPNVESSKLKLLGYLMGSILVGVAGVAIYRYKY